MQKKEMSPGSFKNVIYKLKQIIYVKLHCKKKNLNH